MTVNKKRKNELIVEVKNLDKMSFEEKIEYLKEDIENLKRLHELRKKAISTHNSKKVILKL